MKCSIPVSALAVLWIASCGRRPLDRAVDAGGASAGTGGGAAAVTIADGSADGLVDVGPVDGAAADGPGADGSADGGGWSCVNLECRQASCTTRRGCGAEVNRGPGPPVSAPCPPGAPVTAPSGCVQAPCPNGAPTTVTGTVLDPAGQTPLYNVLVYIPNAALDPLVDGPTCSMCDTRTWGNPVAAALTDIDGRFTLQDVPAGDDVPIVIEIGKWRRQLTLPHVTACADTQAQGGASFRLPRNRGEGHLPRMAVTTGAGDALECFLRKIGIDDAEFTPESGPGRVNLFAGQGGTDRYDVGTGGGASFTAAPTWWDSLSNLQQYDIVMHSCEDVEISTNKSPAARQAFKDYADAGGRAFLSHWHSTWLENGPAPLPSVATFDHQPSLPSPFVASVDVSFPKGFGLADWLLANGASNENGSLQIDQAQHTVSAVTAGLAQRWIYGDPFQDGASEVSSSVQFLTVDTPVEAPVAEKCGRVVLGDLHVSGPDASGERQPFPTGCTTTALSPQEKALEFLFFDQATCVLAD